MLSRNSYPQQYVDTCRAAVGSHLASYDALGLSAEARAGFERGHVHQLVLARDNYFTHRARGVEGKDGNPLNEVRMLCTSVREHDGVLAAEKVIKYSAEGSRPGHRRRDRLRRRRLPQARRGVLRRDREAVRLDPLGG